MDMEMVWNRVYSHLKQTVKNVPAMEQYVGLLTPREYDGNVFVCSADNDFLVNYIEEWFLDDILNALRSLTGNSKIEFRMIIKQTDLGTLEEKQEEKGLPVVAHSASPAPNVTPRFRRDSDPLDPNYTFERFVDGGASKFAYSAAIGVSRKPGREMNPLYIYGDTGLGKTHLMQAVGNRILENNPKAKIRYQSTEKFVNEFVTAIQEKSMKFFHDKYRKVDVLLLDDIHFLGNKSALQEEFFNTFNELHAAHKQIILTSDMPPKALEGLESRLVSRFEMGLVTEIEHPDYETRFAILRMKQADFNVNLPDEWLSFIAQNVTESVRRLEGALKKVITSLELMSPTDKWSLSFEELRVLLKEFLTDEHVKALTCEEIQQVVAKSCNITMLDMTSKARHRSVATPRQIAMLLCRKYTKCSWQEIALCFKKTHGNIMHGSRQILDRMETEPDLRNAVAAIVKQLGVDPAELNSSDQSI